MTTAIVCQKIKNKRRVRKYDLNESYFEKIDTPEKAYWLGFLYADGCHYRNKKIGRYAITLALSDEDIEILYKFKKSLGFGGVVAVYPQYTSFKSKHKVARISFCSQKMSDDLLKHGFMPRKSKNCKFPSFLDSKLINHFLRGVSDGDGTITFNKENKGYWGLICSNNFANKAMSVIEKYAGVKCNKRKLKLKTCSMSTLSANSRYPMYKILKWLYVDANLYLNRKHQKMIEYTRNYDAKYVVQNNQPVLLVKGDRDASGRFLKAGVRNA